MSVTSTTIGKLALRLVSPFSGRSGMARLATRSACSFTLLSFLAILSPAHAAFKAQGPKLVSNNEIGQAEFGSSVSVSGDGNTAIIGGKDDNSSDGAAWIFTRNAGQWTQGSKLLGSNGVGTPLQGYSVSMSADGSTAVVGGPSDNPVGAAWVFTLSNGVWTQQGPKLVGSGSVGNPTQGRSVAISADGNTVISGGPDDSSNAGAAWVFTRSNGVWTQQGGKLVSSDAVGTSLQGYFVALSADGNTAVIGGPGDNSQTGAAWVFTRSNGVWTQQGSKLVGAGAVGAAAQGSVALSADGNTAVIGGEADNHFSGAAWVFTRSGGVWAQQGSKINQILGQQAGIAVALSGDGQVVAVGSFATNGGALGGVSLFTYKNGTWNQLGPNLVGLGSSGFAAQGAAVAFSADGSTILSGGPFDANNIGAVWAFVRFASNDFNGDGMSDILWRNTEGDTTIWFMNGAQISSGVSLGNVPTAWSVVGTGDFNDSGVSDILWRNTEGDTTIWIGPFNTGHVVSAPSLGNVPTAWSVTGIGDFNRDGTSDVLWRNTGGDATIWFMNGNGSIASATSLGNVPTHLARLPGFGRLRRQWHQRRPLARHFRRRVGLAHEDRLYRAGREPRQCRHQLVDRRHRRFQR